MPIDILQLQIDSLNRRMAANTAEKERLQNVLTILQDEFQVVIDKLSTDASDITMQINAKNAILNGK